MARTRSVGSRTEVSEGSRSVTRAPYGFSPPRRTLAGLLLVHTSAKGLRRLLDEVVEELDEAELEIVRETAKSARIPHRETPCTDDRENDRSLRIAQTYPSIVS